VLVSNRTRTHLLIVVFHDRADDEIHAIAGLGDLSKDIRVLFGIGASPDDDRHIHRGSDLLGCLGGFLARTVEPVGSVLTNWSAITSAP